MSQGILCFVKAQAYDLRATPAEVLDRFSRVALSRANR